MYILMIGGSAIDYGKGSQYQVGSENSSEAHESEADQSYAYNSETFESEAQY